MRPKVIGIAGAMLCFILLSSSAFCIDRNIKLPSIHASDNISDIRPAGDDGGWGDLRHYTSPDRTGYHAWDFRLGLVIHNLIFGSWNLSFDFFSQTSIPINERRYGEDSISSTSASGEADTNGLR